MPAVQLRVLSWGSEDAPIALCLRGFPDTAYGRRKVAPMLVDAAGGLSHGGADRP